MDKQALVDRYINDQKYEIVEYKETQNISLNEFKEFVRKWLELDNQIKKIQDVLKEKKEQRKQVSEIITSFMCKHDIEDLNTKEGRIRCKAQYVKRPSSKKVIKEKITDYLVTSQLNPVVKDTVLGFYNDVEKVEKVSLRRLKIS